MISSEFRVLFCPITGYMTKYEIMEVFTRRVPLRRVDRFDCWHSSLAADERAEVVALFYGDFGGCLSFSRLSNRSNGLAILDGAGASPWVTPSA